MNNYNYTPYNQILNKNNLYNPYASNQMNYYAQYMNKNKDEKQYIPNKKNDVYNIYNSNINSINININTINLPNQNNKKISLQEEILSPNIEDHRTRPPSYNYYDDYNFYLNKSRLNYISNYYQNYQNKEQLKNIFNGINKNKNYLYDSYVQNKPRKKIINIDDKKNINQNKKMLILDLDETLVHSCLKPIQIKGHSIQPDIALQVKFHQNYHNVYVLKRPYVDEFLEEMDKYYNIIIFTASVQEYADPLLDKLDKKKVIKVRYYRNSCTLDKNGKFVKDLGTLYKDLSNVILLDNNPISYSYNKSNGLPIITWHFDKKDKELKNLIPVLQFLSNVKDVRYYIPRFVEGDMVIYNKFKNLVEEIYQENEQNEYLKKRPKSTKHFHANKIIKEDKEKEINYKEKENDKEKKHKNTNYTNLTMENKRYEEKNSNQNNKINNKMNENNLYFLKKNEPKYSTINNNIHTDSNEEKEREKYRENDNFYKSQIYEKNEFKNISKNIPNVKNLKKDFETHHKKKEKHRKNKLNNSYKRNNDKLNFKDTRNKSAFINNDNKGNTERVSKEQKINQFINNKNNNINNNIQNDYYKNYRKEKDKEKEKDKNNNILKKKDNYFLNKANYQINNENNLISNYIQNTPFSNKNEKEKDNSYKIFSGMKNEGKEIKDMNPKNNIEKVNLFQINDKNYLLKNDIKKIDIINIYKDYTHKKNMSMENRKDNMNDLYNIREVKIKKEVNERNQSYQNDKKVEKEREKENNIPKNNILKNYKTTENFYPYKINNNNIKENNQINNNDNRNNYYNNRNNDGKYKTLKDFYRQNNNNNTGNSNNNQINNYVNNNKDNKLLNGNDNNKYNSEFKNKTQNIIGVNNNNNQNNNIGNSNYKNPRNYSNNYIRNNSYNNYYSNNNPNNFYNNYNINNNNRYENYMNNIRPMIFSDNYYNNNNNILDYRYDWNKNYLNGIQKRFYY